MSVMDFGNLKLDSGLEKLNNHLTERSYISGYEPTQADVTVFDALATQPKDSLHHILRWYKHISSYTSEKASLPGTKCSAKAATNAAPPAKEKDADDDFDLFGSDDEADEEAERIKADRLKQYAEKKAKKPGPIAKSNIILDVKPWDDETDMAELEKCVRSIQMDGLLWGASKFVPVGYGIKKLQISSVVEDDKVSVDELEERITGFEDYVQSMDIVAFNKV